MNRNPEPSSRPRIPIRRSSQGWVLGVFRGLSQHASFPLVWTRILGVIILLSVGGSLSWIGGNTFVAASCLYLLVAWLMRPPITLEEAGGAVSAVPTPGFKHGSTFNVGQRPPPVPGGGGSATRAVDLAALERQLDSVSRRIARMESIVVTREADWDRRLGGR